MGFFFLGYCEKCKSIQFFAFKISSFSKEEGVFEVLISCNRCRDTLERKVDEAALSRELMELSPFIQSLI